MRQRSNLVPDDHSEGAASPARASTGGKSIANDPPGPQWSTAVSDFVFASTSWLPLFLLGIVASGEAGLITAFGSIGAAASMGVLRFAGVAPSVTRPLHEAMAGFAASVGMPMFGVGFYYHELNEQEEVLPTLVLLVGAWSLFALMAPAKSKFTELYRTLFSFGGVIMIVLRSIELIRQPLDAQMSPRAGVLGIAGAVLIVLAGVVVTPDGKYHKLNILRVDVFHYVLSVAHVLLAWSLVLQRPFAPAA
eukprot:TRINITY_DN65744_c8_g5_i1.p1 TRINITY_DN65744_c8_g5~~TRINITY_DN65744_c8_g5_i1.p1  ORF type:complete len:249 (+),score=96.20 TRINITY_DN65744_c8_g5_i1:93-839(+)